MQAGITLAGFHFEAGARKASEWARKMVEDVGEKIIPYLRGFYENIRYYPGLDTEGISSQEEASDFFDKLSKDASILVEKPEQAKPAKEKQPAKATEGKTEKKQAQGEEVVTSLPEYNSTLTVEGNTVKVKVKPLDYLKMLESENAAIKTLLDERLDEFLECVGR